MSAARGFTLPISIFPHFDPSEDRADYLRVKSFLSACFAFLALAAASHSAAWTASEDKAGQLNVVGATVDGELRIVIKGKDIKVFALINSLERENAPAFEVGTVLGPKKGKANWAASTEPGRIGTLLQAPDGMKLLDELFQGGAATFSMRVAPPGKLSAVADFSLSGLESYKARIQEAQTKPPVPVKVAASKR